MGPVSSGMLFLAGLGNERNCACAWSGGGLSPAWAAV